MLMEQQSVLVTPVVAVPIQMETQVPQLQVLVEILTRAEMEQLLEVEVEVVLVARELREMRQAMLHLVA
jgi:hypothetical protein